MVNNRTIIADLYKKQGEIALDLGQMLTASGDWHERAELLKAIDSTTEARNALVRLAIAYESGSLG